MLRGVFISFEDRDVVNTGPLACDHLIWPPGHLLMDSTGLDWPPGFRVLLNIREDHGPLKRSLPHPCHGEGGGFDPSNFICKIIIDD